MRGGVLTWLIMTGTPFCQALYKGIEGEDWGESNDAYKEMSRAVRVKKPQGAQKAKALWKMKPGKDAGEEYFDPTRQDNIRGRIETRLALWEGHLKDPIVALDKPLKCVWKIRIGGLGPSAWWKGVSQWRALASSKACGKSRSGRAFGPAWNRWIVCVCAQRPWSGMCQGSMGSMARSFSS